MPFRERRKKAQWADIAAGTGSGHTHEPKSVTITRDGNSAVLTVTLQGENTWTISRNIDGRVSSLTDTVYTATVNRVNGVVTGITVT